MWVTRANVPPPEAGGELARKSEHQQGGQGAASGCQKGGPEGNRWGGTGKGNEGQMPPPGNPKLWHLA